MRALSSAGQANDGDATGLSAPAGTAIRTSPRLRSTLRHGKDPLTVGAQRGLPHRAPPPGRRRRIVRRSPHEGTRRSFCRPPRGWPVLVEVCCPNIEGDWDEVFAAVRRCHEVLHDMGVPRVSATLRVGTRTDKVQSLEEKVRSVKEKMK